MSTSRGPLLTLSLGKQQIVLCHSDVRVLQRWDRAISQCAGIDRMLEKVPAKESPRNQKVSKGVAADGGPLAWKTGSVRVLVEGDGDEHQPPVMPPCHATLTPECVLLIDRADAGGGAPRRAHPHASPRSRWRRCSAARAAAVPAYSRDPGERERGWRGCQRS